MKVLKSYIVRLLMALTVLSGYTSCYNDDRLEGGAENVPAAQYINITISVSASESPVTRANPTGGEYGDGREKGIENRENKVNNITLIFFKDDAGVNTTNANTEVFYVKKYEVHPATSADYPGDHSYKNMELTSDYYDKDVVYTTGNQRLEETPLKVGETYQVLVVANADPFVVAGDKIVNVREKVNALAFSGTGVGVSATNFVMASETNASVTLTNPTEIAEENKRIYYFDCIHIERLAARIDFWADKSEGYKNDGLFASTPGYEYKVWKGTDTTNPTSTDRFVLTSITPFNLNNGNEYFFKHTNSSSNPYLHDEVATGTGANWVIDPYTTGKNGTTHPANLVSTLTDIRTTFNNAYNVTMADQYANRLQIGTGEQKDDIIVGYAKENTLRPDGDTPLYYYATGIAFEGYYYRNGTGTGERRVYYHFIRHQGEQETAYNAFTDENIDDAKNMCCPTSPAMNYGIVRNNIYRISIYKITEELLELKIKVKKWDKFEHATIYM